MDEIISASLTVWFFAMMARNLLDVILLARRRRVNPPEWLAFLVEAVYTITDPPVNLLDRVLPALELRDARWVLKPGQPVLTLLAFLFWMWWA